MYPRAVLMAACLILKTPKSSRGHTKVVRPLRFVSSAAAVAVLLLTLTACTVDQPAQPYQLTLLHINDHHSQLDAGSITLALRGADGDRQAVQAPLGGFGRVVAAMRDIAQDAPNTVAVHAGDAITGDLYYRLFEGRADAEMMHLACFDTFTLGNHEFDHGDAGLKTFLDFLAAGPCPPRVLSANVRFGAASPLHPTRAPGRVQPSAVLERGGERIGFIGLTIATKTQRSSRPDPGTTFDDEVITAQAEIDRLTAQGVNKIIVQSHMGYANEVELAQSLRGVDAIVGGDTHSLLGPAAMHDYGLSPVGPYPTRVTDMDGNPVCVVQAAQYGYVLGQLNLVFDAQGRVTHCDGTAHVLLGDDLRQDGQPPPPADLAAALDDIRDTGFLRLTTPSPEVEQHLAPLRSRKQEFGRSIVTHAQTDLCLRRIPGTRLDPARSALGPACNKDPHVIAHGGDMQQLVALALLEQGRRYFDAEIAIQNGGGVRIDLPRGDISVEDVYTLLPFRSGVVELRATGAEIKAALEGALDAIVVNQATGSYPYAAGLSWRTDLTRPSGERLTELTVSQADGNRAPLDPLQHYTVATIDFLADGKDGYQAFGAIPDERRTDVGLDYAEAFLDYLRDRPQGVTRPAAADYSTQSFVDLAP